MNVSTYREVVIISVRAPELAARVSPKTESDRHYKRKVALILLHEGREGVLPGWFVDGKKS